MALPFAGYFDIDLAAIDTRSARGRERDRVVHLSHRAHLRHVKVERHGSHVDRFAGRVGEIKHDFLIALLELARAIGKRRREIAGRCGLDDFASRYIAAVTSSLAARGAN